MYRFETFLSHSIFVVSACKWVSKIYWDSTFFKRSSFQNLSLYPRCFILFLNKFYMLRLENTLLYTRQLHTRASYVWLDAGSFLYILLREIFIIFKKYWAERSLKNAYIFMNYIYISTVIDVLSLGRPAQNKLDLALFWWKKNVNFLRLFCILSLAARPLLFIIKIIIIIIAVFLSSPSPLSVV